ncbi:hypothetical protein [Bifidobacterium choerinum]|uniref:Uncharacterized protein n=1 Tax=Bifidobacterium choerinum TaxID=35760 RepID=A0A2D3D463_9BIFI|nr:hypothetical protein [Bifidobacterium choerinum]ATU20201.1 hypothetical protein BcFMB_03830 [Bifidobacterium choerinum]
MANIAVAWRSGLEPHALKEKIGTSSLLRQGWIDVDGNRDGVGDAICGFGGTISAEEEHFLG